MEQVNVRTTYRIVYILPIDYLKWHENTLKSHRYMRFYTISNSPNNKIYVLF